MNGEAPGLAVVAKGGVTAGFEFFSGFLLNPLPLQKGRGSPGRALLFALSRSLPRSLHLTQD